MAPASNRSPRPRSHALLAALLGAACAIGSPAWAHDPGPVDPLLGPTCGNERATGTVATAPAAWRSVGGGGLVAVIDPLTGGVRAATPEEIGALVGGAGPSTSVSESAPDPPVIRLPNGTLMMRVPERLMMNAIAHRDASGRITYSCQQGTQTVTPMPAASAAAPWENK